MDKNHCKKCGKELDRDNEDEMMRGTCEGCTYNYGG